MTRDSKFPSPQILPFLIFYLFSFFYFFICRSNIFDGLDRLGFPRRVQGHPSPRCMGFHYLMILYQLVMRVSVYCSRKGIIHSYRHIKFMTSPSLGKSFEVSTDHESLKYFCDQLDLKGHKAQREDLIHDFNFSMYYILKVP